MSKYIDDHDPCHSPGNGGGGITRGPGAYSELHGNVDKNLPLPDELYGDVDKDLPLPDEGQSEKG